MLRRPTNELRHGAVIIESAVVYPVTFLLIFGLIIGGLGVFRYQEVASLAREGSRYASVHGANSKSPATAAAVYNNAILPKAVALDPTQLSYTVTWNPDNNPGSTVTVTLNYHWVPEAFLPAMTLSSTSAAVITN